MRGHSGKGFWGRVPGWLSVLTGVMLLAILSILIFGQSAFSHAYNNRSIMSNAALFPFALALALIWALCLSCGRGGAGGKRDMLYLAIYQLCLLAAQLVAARSLWYYTGWDIQSVYVTAEEIARGVAHGGYEYFGLCPNNAPLTIMLVPLLWAGVKLGLAVPYAALPYACAAMHNLTCLMTALCAKRLVGSRRAMWSAAFIMTIWLGLHLFMTVPYTDVFSMFFAVLALYVLLSPLSPFPKAFLFALSSGLGASVKPTVLILFIAAAMLALVRALGRGSWDAAWRRRAAAVAAAVIIGLLPAKLWTDKTTEYLAGSAVPQAQLSAAHYLMIGQNDETYGGHSVTDLEYSRSFRTLKERESANLERALERVSTRSPGENLRFYAIKLFKAYNDGTFAANQSMLDVGTPQRSDRLSVFLRSIYHTKGENNRLYVTIAQLIWLTVLALCAWACFAERGKRPAVPLIALTLLGLTCYQALFEVWPRYLFLYAPFFLLLALTGADGLGRESRKCLRRITERRAAAPE